MKLGNNIYLLRTRKGLSQGDLAEALNVSRQSISKWETGSATPDLDKLLALSDLFGVSLDELVRGEIAAGASPSEGQGEANLPVAPVIPQEQTDASAPKNHTNDDTSTFRIVLICILVFLGLSLFASLLTPLLAGSLHFIVIGIGCILFALRK
jgi:transcriptional regulator with XRE-family HTH domain